ncbi:MAG: formyltransferase [Planctomycetota bacterium]
MSGGAVVLAYHEMGYAGLETLLAHEVPIEAVFSYEDDPGENCWFGSVLELARSRGIETHTPRDLNQPEWVERLRALEPDLLFSFYYRQLVKRPVRAIPRLGCFNLHGSLLPRYRGRSPLNWQLVHGERVSGVTLHRMVARADAGDIVDQEAIPVLEEDTALTLYRRMVDVSRVVLGRSLPGLLAGTAPRRKQDESQATVFGGRKPEDGRIDWRQSALRIHDLVRAVAPPWPGAFCDTPRGRLAVHATRRIAAPAAPALAPGQVWMNTMGRPVVRTGEGWLELLETEGPELRAGDALSPEGVV